ncbi:hypothetical protein AB0J38_31130 [Streptomyces sp. NPDC050095]|uniref:hypothetical protein n=1 Tax=unclassified Streptomyces TaxID=2593676 RepID=UPI0034393F6C
MAEWLRIVAVDDTTDGKDPDAGAGDEALRLSVGALREDLLALEVDRVEYAVDGTAPEGSRSGLAQSVGSLVVSFVPALPLLEALVGVVAAWRERSGRRGVVLEIGGNRLELTGVGRAEQRRLADEWITAVARAHPAVEP